MSRLIRVFEYEKLTIRSKCSEGKELGEKVINKLWQYNDVNNNIYFDGIRNGVKFKHFVGVIQIGNITIEILPKADKQKSTEDEKKNWHDALLKMLAKCKKIRVDSVSKASLRKRNHSLLDLYFELFLQEVNYLLEHGLIKKYRKNNGNLNALKGRLDFGKNIQSNLIHKERFFTTHQVYDYDHLINQILYKALLVLQTITNNTSLSDNIIRTLGNFPEIKEKEINKGHFDSLVANRKSTKYDEALKISKMILLNYSPDIKGGDENMLALLFDMNKLWEEYVYRVLAKNQDDRLKVRFQNSDKFWENKRIKPDIVLTKTNDEGDKETFVIDTKWKVIDPKKPGDDDLKQMFAYNMYWNSSKSMLLYPSSNPEVTSYGSFHKGRDGENKCKLGFIKVMKEKVLNPNLGNEILSLLELNIKEEIL
ncbi:restriction endonuclease [Yeosuana sp. MJ-SS3]|uniref:Restriction endonuclease n=1 Tax=Gilvirhabdus luticola TaxID=3079858 RepID=A0ABU3U7E3_9FLAO|nr:restriction endonuclease [Yeosuana sp. MJ-SS3]MDU8886310.1 restriction endonuclease [Yeosuana sp. MJ-SS3]